MSEKLIEASAIIDCAEAVDVAQPRLHELVTGAKEVLGRRCEISRVSAIHGVDLLEHAQQARHVLRCSAMNEIDIVCRDGCALHDGRDDADDDELDVVASEQAQQLNEVGAAD